MLVMLKVGGVTRYSGGCVSYKGKLMEEKIVVREMSISLKRDVYSAKLIKYSNLYLISAASVRLSQVVVGVSNHKDNGELSVLASFTNLDNRTRVLYQTKMHKSNND
jgi:hypothetical protein